VGDLLRSFGWPDGSIVDVGGLGAARGLEMYVKLWVSMMGAFGSPNFNIKVVRG
jgi:hypothetical protein